MRIIERIPAESAPNAGPYAKSALARRISRITLAHKQHIVPHNPHTQGYLKLLNSTKIQHIIRTTTMRSAFMHIAFHPFLPPPFANADKSMKLNQAACTCGGYDEAAGCD